MMRRSLYQIHDEPEAWWANQAMTDDSATIQNSLLMWRGLMGFAFCGTLAK